MSRFRKGRKRAESGSASCHQPGLFSSKRKGKNEDELVKIYIAGNPNVGKSAIFNKLTGINVMISNYPGTTVEVMEGTMEVDGQKILFKDLPGTYSLGAGSKDQEVAVRAILEEKPDVIIDVVNALNLERNLNLTLQLLELNVPVVIALNQVDFAAKRGISIDTEKLEGILGIPVIPTVAIHGKNMRKLLETALLEATIEHKREHQYHHHGLHHLHGQLHDEHHLHEEGKPLRLGDEVPACKPGDIPLESGSLGTPLRRRGRENSRIEVQGKKKIAKRKGKNPSKRKASR
ncbi:MAG: FeoB small GTPase domain-containing protein [Candidatus Freyarchaeum deiterrae]